MYGSAGRQTITTLRAHGRRLQFVLAARPGNDHPEDVERHLSERSGCTSLPSPIARCCATTLDRSNSTIPFLNTRWEVWSADHSRRDLAPRHANWYRASARRCRRRPGNPTAPSELARWISSGGTRKLALNVKRRRISLICERVGPARRRAKLFAKACDQVHTPDTST